MTAFANSAVDNCAYALRRLVFVGVAALTSTQALGGSFDVNPIRVDLSPANRNAALTVRNNGTESVVVQLSSQAWAQDAGRDVLTATSDVLISPPIVTIAAGAEQVVRVGLRRAPDAQRELAYRLFLQEVPPPPRPGFQGLVVALRIGLPIFVQPRSGSSTATLVWNLDMAASPGAVKLGVENKGTGHIQIGTVELFRASEKEPIAEFSGLAYVLAGQSRSWELKLRNSGIKRGERLRMKVSTDAGSIDTEIEVGGT